MKKGFTLIEMIFVIVIMGILAKFGSEIFRNVYQNYVNSSANNELQVDTELLLQQIGNRLQYRIKDSPIGRRSDGTFTPLSSITDANYTTFEWIGYDIDGWLGDDTNTTPTWSGFIDVSDVANANINTLVSPSSDLTNLGRANTVIQALGGSSIADAAIFFMGANSDARTDYGWDGAAQIDQSNTAAHRIAAAGAVDRITPGIDDFSDTDIYEQYKLSWTAYALELDNGTLRLYYDYQPWLGERYNDGNGTSSILVQNVTTAKIRAIGDMINIQICISENNITGSEYSICKEKAIF
jgi:prepilin-type N-terminal cleavage/methylation domain-containing protein